MFLKGCSASIFTVKQSMDNEVNGPSFFWNICNCLPADMAEHPRRPESSAISP
jgi:hypothetical protein